MGWERVGHGHIHETFLATYSDATGVAERVVYQRLNTDVFTDPDLLAANVARVADHLDGREAARAVPLRAGGGRGWRWAPTAAGGGRGGSWPAAPSTASRTRPRPGPRAGPSPG